MPRYFLELSYEGTRYSGFQVQDGQNTVQSEVTRALEVLYRQPFILTGSSRTDAGVHALQNFFHFDTGLELSGKSLYNLNAILPPDIAAHAIYQVAPEAHCRFDAVSREYKYFIYRYKNPFLVNRAWLYPYPVNEKLLHEMARVLGQYHDFTSFSKRNTQVKNFFCDIIRSEWTTVDGQWVYHICANRFLRGMIRGIVGTMLRIARTTADAGEGIVAFREIIEARNCTRADFSTPAKGLFLVGVNYPDVPGYPLPEG